LLVGSQQRLSTGSRTRPVVQTLGKDGAHLTAPDECDRTLNREAGEETQVEVEAVGPFGHDRLAHMHQGAASGSVEGTFHAHGYDSLSVELVDRHREVRGRIVVFHDVFEDGCIIKHPLDPDRSIRQNAYRPVSER
jgi:hypothetical protein